MANNDVSRARTSPVRPSPARPNPARISPNQGVLSGLARWFAVADHRYTAARLAIVIALALFAAAVLRGNGARSADFGEVSAKLGPLAAREALTAQDANGFQARLGISPAGCDDWLYYASDAVMEVSELLVARCADAAELDRLEAAARDRLDAQLEGFRGYGVDQTALLERAILWQRGGCLFFGVSEHADQWESAFLSCLR